MKNISSSLHSYLVLFRSSSVLSKLLVVLACTLLTVSEPFAQSKVMTHRAGSGHQQFASSVLVVPDSDGRGVDDILIASSSWTGPQGFSDIQLVAGEDGTHIFGSGLTNFTGSIELVGDVNGDSVRDYAYQEEYQITNQQWGGVVRFASGVDGQPLMLSINTPPAFNDVGRDIVSLGDIDGDSKIDFAVSAQDTLFGNQQAVLIISGATLQIVQTVTAPNPNVYFGDMLEVAGDQTGDGIAELWVSNIDFQMGNGDFASLIDPTTGAVVGTRSVTFASPDSHLSTISRVQDLDGDGRDDLLLSMYPSNTSSFGQIGGLAEIVSSRDGSSLQVVHGNNPGRLVHSAQALSDVDGDGSADFVVHFFDSQRFSPDNVSVYSGATGSWLYDISFGNASFGKIYVLGDLTLDGVPEIGVADFGDMPFGGFGNGRPGSLSIYSGTRVTPLGEHCRQAGMAKLSVLQQGSTVTVQVDGGIPYSSGELFISGASDLPQQIPQSPCQSFWPNTLGLASLSIQLDSNGEWSMSYPVVLGQSLVGTGQVLLQAPGGNLQLTNGVGFIIE